MKTIFITIFQGVEAKNILRTDIYKKLSEQKDIRLVFFVGSPERAEYYKKEFSAPNVVYEVANYRPGNFWDRFFGRLKFILLRTETSKLRRQMALQESGNWLSDCFSRVLNYLLAWPLVRRIARALDYRLSGNRSFAEFFDKYDPDLIFLAHLFDDAEIALLAEAKRRGVNTVGFINSWDKLTARAIIRALPDRLVVFNNVVKDEALRHADIEKEKIFVSGIPNYDWHVQHKALSREGFCAARGLDPQKRLIVYAPMGKAYSNSDWDILDLLNEALKNGEIRNAQLFVRFQPNDFTDAEELKKRPWLKYDMPGIRFSSKRGVDWDMSFEDIRGLTDTLANADIFVCYASSMSIDAAVFDKPVINSDFEVRGKELLSKTPTHFYKMTHYKKALATGGIAQPKSREELIRQINVYLENPALDREGRKRLVAEQCGVMDGKAGERIANFLLKQIHEH